MSHRAVKFSTLEDEPKSVRLQVKTSGTARKGIELGIDALSTTDLEALGLNDTNGPDKPVRVSAKTWKVDSDGDPVGKSTTMIVDVHVAMVAQGSIIAEPDPAE